MKIETPISAGEFLDKISILKIKSFKIKDEEKLKNIKFELEHLNKILEQKLSDYEHLEKKSGRALSRKYVSLEYRRSNKRM